MTLKKKEKKETCKTKKGKQIKDSPYWDFHNKNKTPLIRF